MLFRSIEVILDQIGGEALENDGATVRAKDGFGGNPVGRSSSLTVDAGENRRVHDPVAHEEIGCPVCIVVNEIAGPAREYDITAIKTDERVSRRTVTTALAIPIHADQIRITGLKIAQNNVFGLIDAKAGFENNPTPVRTHCGIEAIAANKGTCLRDQIIKKNLPAPIGEQDHATGGIEDSTLGIA